MVSNCFSWNFFKFCAIFLFIAIMIMIAIIIVIIIIIIIVWVIKLFLIHPTSFLSFTFPSLFPAQWGKWVVGCVGICWLGLNHDKLDHWKDGWTCTENGWECSPMATRDTGTAPLEYFPDFGAVNPPVPGTAVALWWSPVGALMGLVRSRWVRGVSCQVPGQVWG